MSENKKNDIHVVETGEKISLAGRQLPVYRVDDTGRAFEYLLVPIGLARLLAKVVNPQCQMGKLFETWAVLIGHEAEFHGGGPCGTSRAAFVRRMADEILGQSGIVVEFDVKTAAKDPKSSETH